MLKPLLLAFVTAMFLLAGAARSGADEQRTIVKVADLPPAVKSSVHEHVGKGRVQEIEKVVDDGEITYEVEMKKNNRVRNFTVGEGGELLEMEVFLKETSEPVREAINKRVANGQLDGIYKIFDNGETNFEVEFSTSDSGKSRSFTLNDKGELSELELFLPETPAPVQKAVRTEGAGKTLGDITEVFEDGETTFEVEIGTGDDVRIVTFDAQGNILSREEPVAQSQVPDPVQKTIHDLMKDAHPGKIIKTTDGDEISYDLRVHRADKWDTVSISPDGKMVE